MHSEYRRCRECQGKPKTPTWSKPKTPKTQKEAAPVHTVKTEVKTEASLVKTEVKTCTETVPMKTEVKKSQDGAQGVQCGSAPI